MKTLLLILFACCSVCRAQESIDVFGSYGKCEDVFHCFQIELKTDYSFKYYINEYVSGKGIVNGTWKTDIDTLILDILLPEKEKPLIKMQYLDTIKNKRIILRTTEKDSLPISNAKVIINDTIFIESDNNGLVCINVFKIDKIAISYFNLLPDSIFYLPSNEKINLIKIYIPLSAGIELIYKQPDKWLIEGKRLIPLILKNGKYLLRRDMALNKIPRRKKLHELKEN